MTVMEIGDLFLDIKAFKEMILKFKINHTEFSEKDWMKWLSQNVTTIDYRDGQYSIVFKALNRSPENSQQRLKTAKRHTHILGIWVRRNFKGGY
ncbi:hypothetical protein EBR57_10710 [bacterium]|nr:hypothetical protein [bacterium]